MSIEDNSTQQINNQRKFPWIIWIILLSLLGAVTYYGRTFVMSAEQAAQNEQKGQGKNNPIAVATEIAKQTDMPVYLNGLGTVTGLQTVTIRSRVDGELIKVAFKEGQMVQSGDLLAEIDPRAFQVQLRQAEGQLLRDEALLKNAETDLIRYHTLLVEDSISAQQTITQEALVKQYKGAVAIDRALVENARLLLSYTKIRAPISGRIGLRLVDQGNMIRSTDANGLAVITQTQPIAVVFTLPEDALATLLKKFHAGHHLNVEAYDRSGKLKLAQGSLLAIDNQIDPSTGTIKLKSEFGNSDGTLFANQFVNIRLRIDTLKSVVTIPTTAVQIGSVGSFVYVVLPNNTVSVRTIEPGPVEDHNLAVLEGLQANEIVVIDGADKLREGQPIKLIKRDLSGKPVVETSNDVVKDVQNQPKPIPLDK